MSPMPRFVISGSEVCSDKDQRMVTRVGGKSKGHWMWACQWAERPQCWWSSTSSLKSPRMMAGHGVAHKAHGSSSTNQGNWLCGGQQGRGRAWTTRAPHIGAFIWLWGPHAWEVVYGVRKMLTPPVTLRFEGAIPFDKKAKELWLWGKWLFNRNPTADSGQVGLRKDSMEWDLNKNVGPFNKASTGNSH